MLTVVHTRALRIDLDGVLINSTPIAARAWTKWAMQHGFDPVEVVERSHGRPNITTIRGLLPNSDHEAENLKIERSEMEDPEGVAPPAGVCVLRTQHIMKRQMQ